MVYQLLRDDNIPLTYYNLVLKCECLSNVLQFLSELLCFAGVYTRDTHVKM